MSTMSAYDEEQYRRFVRAVDRALADGSREEWKAQEIIREISLARERLKTEVEAEV